MPFAIARAWEWIRLSDTDLPDPEVARVEPYGVTLARERGVTLRSAVVDVVNHANDIPEDVEEEGEIVSRVLPDPCLTDDAKVRPTGKSDQSPSHMYDGR
jgi:hypothetical protein